MMQRGATEEEVEATVKNGASYLTVFERDDFYHEYYEFRQISRMLFEIGMKIAHSRDNNERED